MADKKLIRPESVTSWANDATISAAGKPWDTDATKLDPTTAKRDPGWLPDERPAAVYENFLKNEIGQWIQYFSNIQIQNWEDLGAPEEDATPNSAEFVIYDEAKEAWYSGGRANIIEFSYAGDSWLEENPTAIGNATWAVSKPPDDTPIHTGTFLIAGPNGDTVEENVDGTYTARTLPGTATINSYQAIWNKTNEVFVVTGGDNAGPGIWHIDANNMAGGFTLVTLPSPTATTRRAHVIGVDNTNDRIVVFEDLGTPKGWYSDDGGLTWTAITHTIDEVNAITYNEDQALWMAVSQLGVWTSTDAVTWTKVAGDFSSVSGDQFQLRLLIGVGSIWIGATQNKTEIRFSTDRGVTWHKLRLDKGEPAATNGFTDIAYSRYRNQFMLAWGNDPDSGRVLRSLSVGSTIKGIDANVTPTVT